MPTEKSIYRIVLLIGLIAGGRWLIPGLVSDPSERAANSRSASIADCDIQKGPCIRDLADGKVILDIHPKPVVAMRNLRFRITLENLRLEGDPHIDLDMPAMTMGFNRVYLKPTGPGVYEGDGIIVRCPTGIQTWQAEVVLPDRGEVRYAFDVHY